MRFPGIPRARLRADTCTVSRPQVTTDADGRDVSPLVAVPAIKAGTYAAPTSADIAEAGQRASKVDAIVAFPPGTDIRAGDVIVIKGATFNVVAIEDARNRVRAHVRKINPPN